MINGTIVRRSYLNEPFNIVARSFDKIDRSRYTVIENFHSLVRDTFADIKKRGCTKNELKYIIKQFKLNVSTKIKEIDNTFILKGRYGYRFIVYIIYKIVNSDIFKDFNDDDIIH